MRLINLHIHDMPNLINQHITNTITNKLYVLFSSTAPTHAIEIKKHNIMKVSDNF